MEGEDTDIIEMSSAVEWRRNMARGDMMPEFVVVKYFFILKGIIFQRGKSLITQGE